MKNNIFRSFLLCLIMACVKEGPPGPNGPDGPPYTWPPGNITGYIELRSQFGGVNKDRKDSVLLQIYNTDSLLRTYTDTNGYFSFNALPPGNYDISISKPGYDSLHLYVKHAGGEIDKFTGITSMSQHITTQLLSGSTHIRREYNTIVIVPRVIFKWPVPPGMAVSGFRFFLDRSAIAGDGRITRDAALYEIYNIDGVTGGASTVFQIPVATAPSGTQFYVTIAAAPSSANIKPWLDYASGAWISYPYLGDSIKTTITYTE